MPLMGSFFAWIVIGVLVGVATHLSLKRLPGGAAVAILIGIAGALLAGHLAHALGWRVEDGWASHVAAAAGALALIVVYRRIVARRAG